MKRKVLLSLPLTLLAALTTNVFAESKTSYDYVNVYKSQPILETITVKKPYVTVVQEERRVPVRCSNYQEADTNSIGIDTLIGATVGVVIGNQIGKGNGKAAAKVLGGVGGAVIANNTRDSRAGNTGECFETILENKEITKYDYVQEDRIRGYKNYFNYNGQEFVKISQNSPLTSVKITKTISF